MQISIFEHVFWCKMEILAGLFLKYLSLLVFQFYITISLLFINCSTMRSRFLESYFTIIIFTFLLMQAFCHIKRAKNSSFIEIVILPRVQNQPLSIEHS